MYFEFTTIEKIAFTGAVFCLLSCLLLLYERKRRNLYNLCSIVSGLLLITPTTRFLSGIILDKYDADPYTTYAMVLIVTVPLSLYVAIAIWVSSDFVEWRNE